MSAYKLFLMFTIGLFSVGSQAEPIKVLKVFNPQFVSIDRRPAKNIKYSKCFGTFKTENGKFISTAVASAEDRVCPKPESIVLDIEPEKTVSDSGKTESSNVELPMEEYERSYTYKGKDWQFDGQPRKVTVKIPSMADPSKTIEDTFYIASVIDKTSEDTMWISCDKVDTITNAFETRLKIEKPLAIGVVGNASGQNGAAVHK